MDTTQTNEGTSSDSDTPFYVFANKLNFLYKFSIAFLILGVAIGLFYIVCGSPMECEFDYYIGRPKEVGRLNADFRLIGQGIGISLCHIVFVLFVLSQIEVAKNLQQLKSRYVAVIPDGFGVVKILVNILASICLIVFFAIIMGDYEDVVESICNVIYRTTDVDDLVAFTRIGQIMNLKLYFAFYSLYWACCLWYFAQTVELIGANTELVLEKEALRKEKEAFLIKQIRTLLSNMIQIPGKEYMMCKYVVTQELYEAVMANNPSYFKGQATRPVDSVSWSDIQEFLKKLNELSEVKASGLVYRLPTADEWEYACRAGATGDYCKLADGTEITKETLSDVAWFENNSNEETHPVGQKKPNAYGLYDMHGNVMEWTSTFDGDGYLYCGGSWSDSHDNCQTSNRNGYCSTIRFYLFGFRLCASRRAGKV